MTVSVLILATALAAQDDWRPPTPLDWLHGTWIYRVSGGRADGILRREHWQPDDWSGTHVRVDEVRGGFRGEVMPLASGRILEDNGGYSLSHRMQGATGGEPASYRSVCVGEREAEFMTDEAVEPQRIVFRRTATSLVVTHSRRDGGGARSWHMLSEASAADPRACDNGA